MLSERRHQEERLKKARRFYWGCDRDLAKEPDQLGQAVDTPTRCSCWMCGNPRRYFKERSLQERSAEGLFIRLGLDG